MIGAMRPRKTNRHLPACVYHRNGAYYYVKRQKWRMIGRDLQSALAEYARIVAQADDTMPTLIDRALPAIMRDVAPSTVKQYAYSASILRTVFAEFRPHDVRASDVVKMLDGYAETPATATRLLVVLNLVFRWACERDIVAANPCREVQRPPPLKRDRLITRGEYDAIRQQASPRLQAIMDICRLTGQRIGDVLSIRRADLEADGIRFRQQKTGRELVVAWTPELRAAVARAKALTGTLAPLTLFYGRSGEPPQYTHVQRAFQAAATAAGVADVRLHDLRALAATEAAAQGLDPSALLGHRSARTTDVYLRDKGAKLVQPPTFTEPAKRRKSR